MEGADFPAAIRNNKTVLNFETVSF